MLVPLPQVQPLPPREDASESSTKRTKNSKPKLLFKHTRRPKSAVHGPPLPKSLTFDEGKLPGADDVVKPPPWLKASKPGQA